jgi:hypothetical protein
MNDDLSFSIFLLVVMGVCLPFTVYMSTSWAKQEHNYMMNEVLAKSCIEKPTECKSYRDYYTSVKNFKK